MRGYLQAGATFLLTERTVMTFGEYGRKAHRALTLSAVVAWGSWGKVLDRAYYIQLLLRRLNPYCLGHNKDGQPKHPLYLPLTTRLERFVTGKP